MSTHKRANRASGKDAGIHNKRQVTSKILNLLPHGIHSDLLQRAVDNPRLAEPGAILQLQRLYGNRLVGQMYEQEADRMANQELNQMNTPVSGSQSVKRWEGLDKQNKTGIPDKLNVDIEYLSGMSVDDVRVYYNSTKPARLQTPAYTQSTKIHLERDQEKHSPHETWRAAQQKKKMVKPMMQTKGMAINNDTGLKNEADMMGSEAMKSGTAFSIHSSETKISTTKNDQTIQRWTIGHRDENTGRRVIVSREDKNYELALRYLPDSALKYIVENGKKY